MSGYDYHIYRYLISNFILDNKDIYKKYKKNQSKDNNDDSPSEFYDENIKKCNIFFYNIILK